MSGDVTVQGHVRGPLIGADSLGWHTTCQGCGHRVEGRTQSEVVDAHEQHVAGVVLRPGVAKARAALADTVARKAAGS